MDTVIPTKITMNEALLSRIRDRVYERKPFLKAIIEKLGEKSILHYVHGYADVEIHPLMQSRKVEFLDTFEREVTETLSPELAKKGRRQLEKTFFVSTNDHHGPMNAFDAFNAHLVLALDSIDGPPADATEAVIVFSCCNVSLNNISFPRGLLYSVNAPDGLAMKRLSLLPSNSHSCSLYGYRSYEPREIEKLRKLLRQNVRDHEISPAIAEKLDYIVTNIFGDPAILGRKMYSAQSSIINGKLWDLVFQGQSGAPAFVSVGQERIVARILQDHHLRADTLIHRLLFHPDYERLTLKYFDGIYGAFSMNEGHGTYLFWGRSASTGMRLRMQRSGADLVSDDRTLSVPWTPEGIAEGLKNRTLIPSILLVFEVLSFYYGLKCLGGYSQVNYLTFMKDAFIGMMNELGETEAALACGPVSTKNWSGFSFSYLQSQQGLVSPAQFIDLYLYKDTDMWRRLMDYAHVCTLDQAIQPLLPEIYRYSYPETERETDLVTMTTEDIATFTKMLPCVRMV